MSRIDKIIEELLGTSQSLENVCNYFGISVKDLIENEIKEIDEEIFQCDGCGWWCETSERNDLCGDALCEDCLLLEVHQD